MATSFAPQSSAQSQPTPYYYNQPAYSQGHFTPPAAGTPPSTNISPTNSHVHVRHLRQPRQCAYVPAVLRPTEMPVPKRNRPLTPPRSANSSMDSKGSGGFTVGAVSLPTSPADDGSSFFGPVEGVSRIVSDEWNDETALGAVSGQSTRNHWKPDSSASCCSSPTCTTFFTFLVRRHHCRRCGDIFCQPHSTNMVPLDQEARFHPSGIPQRSCDLCWADYHTWHHARKSRASSIESGDTATARTGAINVIGGHDSAIGMGTKDSKVGSIAASVPRDWNWSTF